MQLLEAGMRTVLEPVKQQIFEAYRHDAGFTGCAVGFRRKGGRVTDEPAVIAMVTKKLPAGAVSRSRLLPASVSAGGRDWCVDVVEVGPLRLAADPAQRTGGAPPNVPITQMMRPPLQGCSISDAGDPRQVSTGTLGCLVRDRSDGTICIFSSSAVLANAGAARRGALVIQPGAIDGGTSDDGIAKLKRDVRYMSGTNYVDAAIAQLTDQKSYSENVAEGLMKPISAAHPAVGVCFATDADGFNAFLTPIENNLGRLGVELLPAKAGSPCTVAAQVGMNIEKVGRTSGYTSSVVDAVAAQVKVTSPSNTILTFADLIWSQAFFLPGDNGAVVCHGGNGRTLLQYEEVTVCILLGAVGKFFHIPLGAGDNALTNQFKNEFLAQSLIGNLIIGLIYNNRQTAIDRMKGKKCPSTEQAYALALYKKYKKLAEYLLAHPRSTTPVVTQENLDDYQFVAVHLLGGLGGAVPLINTAEFEALMTLYNTILVHTKGMDHARLVAYMNDVAVYEKALAELKKVRTLKLTGTIADDPLKK
jgi:hypothetical protein